MTGLDGEDPIDDRPRRVLGATPIRRASRGVQDRQRAIGDLGLGVGL